MNDDSDIVRMLTNQVERLFQQSLDREAIDIAEKGKWPADLWQASVDMGLPLLLVPEEQGGSGLSWVAAISLFKLLGHYAVPLPVGETVLAAKWLADAGLEIPDGPLTIAPASSNGNGSLISVPWARNASHLVSVTVQDGVARTDCIALSADAVTMNCNIGRDPRDTVTVSGSMITQSASRQITGENPAMIDGALLRAGQMAGALQSVTAMAAEYANVRAQFGRPISKFQAVQQSLAQLASEAAAAAVAAMAAAAARDGGSAYFEIAVAKVRTGQAAGVGSALSHQTHGAIGFTDEHQLHYLTRRLLSWRSEFGSERYWARALGRHVLDSSSDTWSLIVDPAACNRVSHTLT